MIDYWLIFTLMLPFVDVLLHIYMESLNDDEDRTINHLGVAMCGGVGEKSNAMIKYHHYFYYYADTSSTKHYAHKFTLGTEHLTYTFQ